MQRDCTHIIPHFRSACVFEATAQKQHLLRASSVVVMALLLASMLAACSTAQQDFEVNPPMPTPTAKPIAKDEKLMKDGKVGDYVNAKAPSQARYSLYQLNQGAETLEYPAIEDISEPKNSFRTEEERKRIEEELRALNKRH